MNNDERGVGESHTNLAIRLVPVAGGAAGPLTVPGWTPGSSIKSVLLVTFTAGTPDTLTHTDLTAEFTETATGIDNTGGTATTGSTLLVLFIAAHPKGGSLTRR